MRKHLVTFAALLTVFATGAVAGDIYKWTDEEGNVHYEDRPVSSESERVAIQSKPTDPAKIQAMAQARTEASAQAREQEEAAAAAAQAAGPSPEELQAQAQERARQCATYRERLQKMITSRRLYREDAAGERVYLDEAETQAARERVEAQVEDYCSS